MANSLSRNVKKTSLLVCAPNEDTNQPGPDVIKASAEHEICPANKYQIAKNC